MRVPLLIKRILFLSAIAFSVLLPGFTATTTYAAGTMDGMAMGQSTTDLTNCLERHQAPAASVHKESKQTDPEDKDEPIPPSALYNVNSQKPLAGTAKPARNLIESSSFVPPDILILTSILRI